MGGMLYKKIMKILITKHKYYNSRIYYSHLLKITESNEKMENEADFVSLTRLNFDSFLVIINILACPASYPFH
jgi:hypothetical protein